MLVTVYRVNIPVMSTIGYGWGKDQQGNEVKFCGDHRPMLWLVREIKQAAAEFDLPVVNLDDWQIIGG